MDDFEPNEKKSRPSFFLIITYILMGIFAFCFAAGHFYYSEFDYDSRIRMDYGEIIGLGGWFVFFIGYLLFNYFRAKYF